MIRTLRISAVVIVFNLEDFIEEAIESVLAQTRKADEIIVVDDCSSDSSAERVKAFGGKVRYRRMPENSGALLAALDGVRTASGDIICMLDGDDYWAANKLQVIEREFSADANLMLLSHRHIRVNDKGADLLIRDETHRNINYLKKKSKSTDHFSELLKDAILDQKGFWLGSAYAFRKSSFNSCEFSRQIDKFGTDRLRTTYLDLAIAPFLVLTNPSMRVGYTSDTVFSYRIHERGSMGGHVSVEKARQSALKGRTINELIDLILRENCAAPAHLRRRGRILQEYDFLAALYEGEFIKAARLYVRLAGRHWKWRRLMKETQRLIIVGILGPRKFVTLKHKM